MLLVRIKICYNKVMFVDTAKVSLKAGKGGDGAVSFRHEIYVPKGGPDGGDGGKGGDIIFRADKDTNTLIDFRFTPILEAEPGKNGSGQRSAGRSGKDLIIDVPIGTVVYKISTKSSFEGGPEPGKARSSATTPVATGVVDAPRKRSFLADKISYTVVLTEGRNRQIRRTFAALGYKVTKLHRTNFGKYELNDLKPGKYVIIEP